MNTLKHTKARKAKDGVASKLSVAALLAALLTWASGQADVERNQASGYNLTKYRPKPKAFDTRKRDVK
jgi:hypothetical protein